MTLFDTAGDDYYYWLTSVISAHGLQRWTCRLIGTTALLLGLIPLLTELDRTGALHTTRLAVGAGIAACTAVIAAIWTRGNWPTRARSRACAIAGTACVTAAVLTLADPLVAALGCLAFAGPAGFTALFHTRRLLIATAIPAAAALIFNGVRLASSNPLLAAAVVAAVVAINVFAAAAWLLVVHLSDTKVSSALIDPVTGLLNRTAFDERVAVLLGARDRQHDRYLVIAVVGIDTHTLLISMGLPARAEQTCITAAHQLRTSVRRDTVLAYRGGGDFIVADVFNDPDPHPLLERLRGTLTDRPAQLSASIGAVSTPLAPLATHSSADVLDELLHLADRARLDSRRAGGNTAHCLIEPPLIILDQRPDEDSR